MSSPSEENQPQSEQPTVGLTEGTASTSSGVSGDRFGDYLLVGELGRGGMGVVFKAFEPNLGRYVAIKMILSGTFSGEDELTRFRYEASAAARLHHPNIVKVHRVGIHEGRHFFAMDYIEGQSLSQRLSEGPMTGRQAAKYLVTIARAIEHAHSQGILHRDLKPANILIGKDDQPQVMDFGLAKQLATDSGQTRTGALLGTPSYMAPEQAAGTKLLTPATDVYGLGALLYELLTGRPPFQGDTTLDTVLQVLEKDPAPPRSIEHRIERDLETICLKCLAKDPRDRYHSAEGLAVDLSRYLEGESIHARSLNIVDYLGRTFERSHFDVEFGRYGNVVLWFAGIVGTTHLALHVGMTYHAATWVMFALHAGQFALMLLVLWRNRKSGLMPTSTAERLLWSVWVGYVIACAITGEIVLRLFGPEAAYQGKLYPFFCAMTGFAFFVLGSSYWGMCYAIAFVFWATTGLLLLDPSWGALVYGGLWTLALLFIGLRLRRLGVERGGK